MEILAVIAFISFIFNGAPVIDINVGEEIVYTHDDKKGVKSVNVIKDGKRCKVTFWTDGTKTSFVKGYNDAIEDCDL